MFVCNVCHLDVLVVLGVPLLVLAFLVWLFTVRWVSIYWPSALLSLRGWFPGVRLALSCSRPSFLSLPRAREFRSSVGGDSLFPPFLLSLPPAHAFRSSVGGWRFLVLGSVVFSGPLLVANVTSYTASCLTLSDLVSSSFSGSVLPAFALSHPGFLLAFRRLSGMVTEYKDR